MCHSSLHYQEKIYILFQHEEEQKVLINYFIPKDEGESIFPEHNVKKKRYTVEIKGRQKV